MEFFEEARKLGVPDIHITEEEWQKNYNNSYSVLALNGSDIEKIFAAQDIIKTYLVLQARQAAEQTLAPDACPYCRGKGEEPLNKIMVRCRFCAGTGKCW